jgi:DNA polymerase elongation subunit (family B)
MAEAVTAYGREVLGKMVTFLRSRNCEVIEIDTDGTYFTYPDTEDPYKLLEDLNATMDEGIKIDFEKKFKSMISYMDKTYVLMPENYPKKKIIIKGSAFRKRGMQPFLKKWMATSFEKLLTFDLQGYDDNCYIVERSLGLREMDVEEIVEYKKISFDYKHYINRPKQIKMGHFEAMRREGKEKDYKAGDKVSFYYAGEKQKQKSEMVKLYHETEKINDYNCDHYISQLHEWMAVFKPFYEQIKLKNTK